MPAREWVSAERKECMWCEASKAERMSKYFFWLMLNIHPKNFVESEYVHINIDFIHVLFHFEKWWREKKLKFPSTCRNAKRSTHKSFYCEAFKLSHKNFNMPHNSEDEIDGFRLLAFRSEKAAKARVEKKYESEISSVAHSYLVSFHFDKCSVVSRFFAGWIWIDSELRLRDWQGEWREERKYIKNFFIIFIRFVVVDSLSLQSLHHDSSCVAAFYIIHTGIIKINKCWALRGFRFMTRYHYSTT